MQLCLLQVLNLPQQFCTEILLSPMKHLFQQVYNTLHAVMTIHLDRLQSFLRYVTKGNKLHFYVVYENVYNEYTFHIEVL